MLIIDDDKAVRIEKLGQETGSDNKEYKQALKELKNTIEDLDKVFSFTEKGLEEISEREKNRVNT